MNRQCKELIEEAKEWASIFYDEDEPEFWDVCMNHLIVLTLRRAHQVIHYRYIKDGNTANIAAALDSITTPDAEGVDK
jgi:hypothetical protein